MNLLFLCHKMAKGFGVSVVVDALSRQLAAYGHRVTIGCLEDDGHFAGLDIRLVDADPAALRALAAQSGAEVVIAHTTPYFEALPALAGEFRCWAWEHGDPSPELFAAHGDSAERAAIAEHKRQHVYPHLQGVIAISHFIRSDIGWPAANVIGNGADHVPEGEDAGFLPYAEQRPLRVGTLMRLGTGEAYYKGGEFFLKLAAEAAASGIDCRFAVMGRGEKSDAADFRQRGIDVHLNASDAERSRFLQELDVFVSCSLWEGFNLPLVEAARAGTACIAFDSGAHPEVTPLVVSDTHAALSLLRAYAGNRDLLARHSRLCARHIQQQFRWETAALALMKLLGAVPQAGTAPAAVVPGALGRRWQSSLPRRLLARAYDSWQRDGLWCTLARIRHYLRRRFS